MSKFDYLAEGELNSKYTLDLLNEYLAKLEHSNDTKGIIEDDFKINVKANKFVRWFKDFTKRIGMNKATLPNYNMTLATQCINEINDKIKIYLQTNVLEARQIFDLNQTLKAINFDIIIPEIEEGRQKAIKQSTKRFLKVLTDVKYLKNAYTEHILFNSPVSDIKPFMSDKVSKHNANPQAISELIKQYIELRNNELTTINFEPYDIKFKACNEDFYNEIITDNGVGEEVEKFIRQKMVEKLEICKQEDKLVEDNQAECAKIDVLLKKLKLIKIEQMLQKLIVLKTNLAHAKEVMDNCKETINSSTIDNKARIFLIMDNLYYKLSKQCETLQEKAKLKLQLVDKQKMFAILDEINNPTIKSSKRKSKTIDDDIDGEQKIEIKTDISSSLYDDDDDEHEIQISEDDTSDNDHEEEVVIDDDED